MADHRVGYLAAVAVLGIAAGNRLPMQLAVVISVGATLVFQPLRRRINRLARRLVFGERLTSEQLLQKFGETLEHAYDLAELAPHITTAARHGLDLQWARLLVRFETSDGPLLQRVGSSGIGVDDPASPDVTLPLTHAGQDVGVLECGPKAEGRFTERDRELLATLGRQAALAIHVSRLAAELAARLDEIEHQAEEIRASRARIVQAQDTERRRIERDLHDGIQQELVALKARLRLVRNQLRRDPDEADSALSALQHEVGQIISELRELARGIHPPVLTDRGLVEAVESRAAALPIGVAVLADPQTRASRFTQHIEAVAYFIISEALANVLKHAHTTTATVRISSTQGRLHVEVSDDGVGFTPAATSRSGLTGLRDRVDAIGGQFAIMSQPGHGTEGIAAAHAIRARHPGVGVVVLSQYVDEAYAFGLLKDGTAGLAYLLKDRVDDTEELVRSLHQVHAERSVIDPEVVEKLVGRRARLADSPLHRLTTRELDVLQHMAQGKTNTVIAEELMLSRSAVEKHISSVFSKLDLLEETQAHRRVAAVITYLREVGLPEQE